jgi:diaminohydroxyphosphoribosylaminopyrimidine deaminase/5-amino-6-(5-phosphoribosylamino)uracil reductase
MVGCVLVREGEIVGEGWHSVYGGQHAEVMALGAAGDRARGATAFVSLEPCRHEGKTPPCTRALLAAGVARVVFGAADPGEDSGGGGKELAAAGVEVLGPLFTREEAARENPGFFQPRADRPWIAVKLALSLDARIAAKGDVRTLLSGAEATEEVHRLRAGFDAIMVGSRTAVIDDPLLTVRGKVTPRLPPRRVVLDSRGSIGAHARLFRESSGEVWILTTEGSPPQWREAVGNAGGRVFVLPADREEKVELRSALALLKQEGVRTLLCEGGGLLASALLEIEAVDSLHLVLAPIFLGTSGVAAFSLSDREGGNFGERWVPAEAPRKLGEDLWITLERRHD